MEEETKQNEAQKTDHYCQFLNVYFTHLYNCIQNDPEYSYTKANCSDIGKLAEKMLNGLITGAANKDGKAVKLTCKQLKIPHTYKAIREFVEK